MPVGERQVRVVTVGSSDGSARRVVHRDVEYPPYGLIVELDGRLGHADALSRWRDMSRDNAAAISGKPTLRFGYQLVSRPCETTTQVVAALHHLGWTGSPRPCAPTCPLRPSGGEVLAPIRGQNPPRVSPAS
ncbi:hypothetical protein [Kribbella sp. CA-293567]|uniref:hypothetical protein n=1 Tax=Kribbella sp. CA-293567 TaxID=3002436 RepID=UPI0022DD237E|nr:hypothetical protein [Kribbella sp. CA-293567]WBQ02646.1 hypothetical protein OX958_21975 [Kribbella sp. CA-293567]